MAQTNANLYGTGGTSDDESRQALAQMDTGATAKKKKAAAAEQTIDPTASLYWREIEKYNRATSDWYQEGDEIESIYLDAARAQASGRRKFALLWANVEVMKPAVYAKAPTVLCSRRYKDRDSIGRVTAELLERASNTTLELYNVDETFRMVRDDRLIPGRGQAWVRYEATIETYDDEKGTLDNETGDVIKHERFAGERVCVDYVHWKDFGHNICRTWTDVWLVWRINYKTRDEVAERFGGKAAASLSYSAKTPAFGSGSATDEPENRCKIYEIWDRQRRRVSWMAEGQKTFLDTGEPPIDFAGFFPCPEPTYATKTSKELIPVPDYRYYRDQAKDINDLTDKIGHLTEWLTVKAFIPGAPSGVTDAIEEAIRDKGNREMVQTVESWQEWSDRGGVAKMIEWLPIDQVVKALTSAIEARDKLIQDVFQATGISDILRGQSDPNETLGAQELKAQTGTRRLRNTQGDIARFTRDIARLVAEVIAEKFEPESIAEITGFKYVPQQPQMMQPMLGAPAGALPGVGGPQMPMLQGVSPGAQAGVMPGMMPPTAAAMDDSENVFDDRHMALLRNNRLRDFRIDIETDSTVQPDENAEKASRMELLNTVGPYLEKVVMAAAQAPDLAPAMGEMLMYTVRGFHAGRSIEESLEQGFAKATKRLIEKMSQPPPPDPRIEIEKGKQQIEGARVQNEARRDATDAQLASNKQQIDAGLEKRKQDLDASLELRHQNIDATAQARHHAAKLLGDFKPTGEPQ